MIAQCLALLALAGDPGTTFTGVHSLELGIEWVLRQGLLGLSQALLGLLLLLAAAGDGRLLCTILTFQMVACLLCFVPGLSGCGQLRVFLRLLGGKLGRFRRNRRLLAEGVVESTAHRTGGIFL